MIRKILCSTLALTLVWALMADAAFCARLGGGGSFGSKSSYSRSYSPSRTPYAPSAPVQSAPKVAQPAPAAPPPVAAPQAPSMFSRMGWGLGGFVAGGLLGSMLFGGGMGGGWGGGGGMGLLDMLLIGLVIFLAFKLFRRVSSGSAAAGNSRVESSDPADTRSRAEQSWDQLRTKPETGGPVGASSATGGFGVEPVQGDGAAEPLVPAGFNIPEFLEGAKTVYARLQHSWDRRDLKDIGLFTTPEVLAEISRQAAADPTPSKTELLLVNAKLLEFREELADTVATVLFDVLMREDVAEDRPKQIREVWHFSRPTADLKANWRLEGIQQLDS